LQIFISVYNKPMIKDKNGFFLGVFVLLVWTFFGIPTSWKVFLTILSALYLIVLSVKITLPRKAGLKRPRRREKVTPVWSESAPAEKVGEVLESNESKTE